jgi:hypothetical protein
MSFSNKNIRTESFFRLHWFGKGSAVPNFPTGHHRDSDSKSRFGAPSGEMRESSVSGEGLKSRSAISCRSSSPKMSGEIQTDCHGESMDMSWISSAASEGKPLSFLSLDSEGIGVISFFLGWNRWIRLQR